MATRHSRRNSENADVAGAVGTGVRAGDGVPPVAREFGEAVSLRSDLTAGSARARALVAAGSPPQDPLAEREVAAQPHVARMAAPPS